MKNKRIFLLTGISDVDPFTRVVFKPNERDEAFESLTKEKKLELPSGKISTEYYLDGSILNILRKHLENNNAITDVYIYITKGMIQREELCKKLIRELYISFGVELPCIEFYPKDKSKLRQKDVHIFTSYYKEIYEMYKVIAENNSNPKIYINISSGTPAFKSDILLFAVRNDFGVEQSENVNLNKIDTFMEEARKTSIYKEMNKELEKLGLEDKISIVSDPKQEVKYDKNILEKITKTEKLISNNQVTDRAKEVSINEAKKIMLLESVEDSIKEKDYRGVYYAIKGNKEYLDENDLTDKLLEVSRNLYYRYIGNDKEANLGFDDKKKEYYPILNITSFNDDEKLDELNNIIEKFNMMKTKSKRAEINDWLLITTPLIEAILKCVVERSGIDTKKIIDEKKHIDLKKFENNYKNDNTLFNLIKENVSESNNRYLNWLFYSKLLYKLRDAKNEGLNVNGSSLKLESDFEAISQKFEYIRKVVDGRNSSAHTIKSLNKDDFEEMYKAEIDGDVKCRKSFEYYKDGEKKCYEYHENCGVNFVEKCFEELIKEILPKREENEKYCDEALKMYQKLEKEIKHIISKEIYGDVKE